MGIRIENVSFRYGSRVALDNVSLTVKSGQVVALFGTNGCGKSTLLRVVCGLLAPQHGSVQVAGCTFPHQWAAARSRVGYVPQQFGMYDDLTAEENLIFFARAMGLDKAAAARAVGAVIERLELEGWRRILSRELSHGWRQRLALASALAHRPRVLLLDEATAGLDPVSRKQIWSEIEHEAAAGTAVLVSTHHLDEAQRCSAVACMRDGRFGAIGRYSELESCAEELLNQQAVA